MKTFEHISQKIRELRNEFNSGAGLSQEALAKEIGVAANTISRWETGSYKPSVEDLEKLSKFFGISILKFFPNEQENNNESIKTLLRAASDLDKSDIDELTKYAEFRKARKLHLDAKGSKVGRKAKPKKDD